MLWPPSVSPGRAPWRDAGPSEKQGQTRDSNLQRPHLCMVLCHLCRGCFFVAQERWQGAVVLLIMAWFAGHHSRPRKKTKRGEPVTKIKISNWSISHLPLQIMSPMQKTGCTHPRRFCTRLADWGHKNSPEAILIFPSGPGRHMNLARKDQSRTGGGCARGAAGRLDLVDEAIMKACLGSRARGAVVAALFSCSLYAGSC